MCACRSVLQCDALDTVHRNMMMLWSICVCVVSVSVPVSVSVFVCVSMSVSVSVSVCCSVLQYEFFDTLRRNMMMMSGRCGWVWVCLCVCVSVS